MENRTTEMVITKRVDAQIDFNYEQAERYLESLIGDMKGWVIQQADLSFAKDTLADLNKLSKNVEDFRKKHKKEMEKPIKEFETKCKSLVEKINEVYSPLKLQYEGFEEKRKANKKVEVMALIEEVKTKSELPNKYADMIQFNDKYLNKTEGIKAIEIDLWAQAELALKQLEADRQHEEYVKTICEMVNIKNGLSVELDYKNFVHLEKDKAKEQIELAGQRALEKEKEAVERIRQQEEKKAQELANKKVDELVSDTLKATNEAMQTVIDIMPVENEVKEAQKVYSLTVIAEPSKMRFLEKYMKQFEFEYIIAED